MPEPTPPEYFNERKRRIFRRVYQNLVGRGLWEPMFSTMVEMLAGGCDIYLTLAELDPDAPDTREMRTLARISLREFLQIDEKQIPLGEVDENGIDVQIKKLAE